MPAKEPVLQIFVRPVGLPQREGTHVIVVGASDEILASTNASASSRDPLFSDPLELWGSASGKEAALKLTFMVCSSPEEVLAEASISSSELRKLGLYNPREGAAVALPLKSSQTVAPDAALHCYVHVGYSVRKPRGRQSQPQGAARGLRPADGSTGGDADLVDHGAAASGAAGDHRSSQLLRLEYAIRPLADPLAVLLHVRGRNASRRHAVRLGRADLHVAAPGWEGIGCPGSTALDGTVVPPRGRFETTFILRQATEAEHAAASPSHAELSVQYAPLSLPDAAGESCTPSTTSIMLRLDAQIAFKHSGVGEVVDVEL